MDIEKMREVVLLYKKYFGEIGVKPKEFTKEQYDQATVGRPLLEHCGWMLDKMEIDLIHRSHPKNVTAHLMGKYKGWIGFVQGVTAERGIFSVTELRDHSKQEA